jgi:hypothetical protein
MAVTTTIADGFNLVQGTTLSVTSELSVLRNDADTDGDDLTAKLLYNTSPTRQGDRIGALEWLALIDKAAARQKRVQEQRAVSMLGQKGVDLVFLPRLREANCRVAHTPASSKAVSGLTMEQASHS